MTSRDGGEMEIPKSALERDSILKMVWGSLFPTSFFLSLEFVQETTPKRILLCFAVFYVITAGIFPLSQTEAFTWGQPFQGGHSFVLLQALGWTMTAITCALSVILAVGAKNDRFNGLFAIVLSGFCFFGNFTLQLSIPYFNKDKEFDLGHVNFSRISPVHKWLPPIIFMLMSSGTYLACDLRYADNMSLPLLCAACTEICACVYIHFISSRNIDGWQYFQPFRGGISFSITQAMSWILVSFVMYYSLIACLWGDVILIGLPTLCAINVIFSTPVLLMSLALFAPVSAIPLPIKSLQHSKIAPILSKIVWIVALVLAILPFTSLGIFQFSPRLMLVCMFISAPISHFSGVLRFQRFSIIQPMIGGVKFIILQSIGWFLYGVSLAVLLTLSLNFPSSITQESLKMLIPLCFFAQVLISISIQVWQAPAATPVESDSESSVDTHFVHFSMLVIPAILFAVIIWGLGIPDSREHSGWLLFAVLAICTISGFHLVWTHVWLIASGAVIMTGNELGLAVCACLGVNVSVCWYCALFYRKDVRVPARAMMGWSRWICTELVGLIDEWERHVSWKNSLLLGFHLTDLGLHLLPTLILLQLAAQHITFLTVVLGYVATRIWSFAITTIHWKVDWSQIRSLQVAVKKFQNEFKTSFVDRGVINLIYSFEPPAPPSFFHFCLLIEGFCAATGAAITLLFPKDVQVSIFETLGAKPIVGVEALLALAALCVVMGTFVIFGGAVIGYSLRKHRKGKVDQRDYFQQHVHDSLKKED